ncbi:hypothetical protein A8709_03630 [Paenibacillus pectinilyticus]|uniref:Lipoprotein n=1 Tax=Paenibacillus pectinilyticus TaxID=512399 RepID=A0A1C0ZYY8_9BACL|nr:hypothetical protein [Paenibacillus pectinilyticus]OCT13353.1 hypothetical protein A8709_03630 [Paenibacillus pectinilyticus]
MRRITVQLLLLFTLCLALVGCERSSQQTDAVAGDKLYIPEGYTKQLSSLKLTEVAPLPYFSKPFICVAKDAAGQQFAVVFQSVEKVETVKLPITYENILKRIVSEGFEIKVGTPSEQNLHMFEINNKLFWNFADGKGNIFLTLQGEVITSPF